MMELQDWDDLIQKHLNGQTAPEEAALLSDEIVATPEIRSRYLAAAQVHAALTNEVFALDTAVDLPPQIARRENAFWRQIGLPGLAALLMICLTLLVLLWPEKKQEKTSWDDAIARIEFLSDDVGWGEDQSFQEGSELDKGWVQLERGKIRLTFRSGAVVEAEGPAALGIDTPMRVYLDFGKVKVHAPESARDFIVATESMEVVDLGTRFEVDVDRISRESNVSVTEGLVDIHLGSPGTDRTIRPLVAGQAARLDASGKIIKLTNHDHPQSRDSAKLIAHWTFDDEDLTTQKPPNHLPGVIGQGLEFKNKQFIDLEGQLATLTQLDSFTFSTWVCDPDETHAMVFSVSGDSEQDRIQLYLARSYVRYGWQDGLHFDSISGRVDGWNPSQWYHVAVTVKDGVARLYRDGELVGSGSSGAKIGTPVLSPSLVKNPSHAAVGRLEDGNQGQKSTAQWFEGQLDDVRIYNSALEQSSIRSLYKNPGQ